MSLCSLENSNLSQEHQGNPNKTRERHRTSGIEDQLDMTGIVRVTSNLILSHSD